MSLWHSQNLVAFLQGMKLRYNDGSGTQDIVTLLSSDFIEDMRLKCKIKLSNDSVILVDPETLNFIENPDIALIPQTSSDYIQDSANITPLQMEHIMYPKALSPLQEEKISHHTWLPFTMTKAYNHDWSRRNSTLPCVFEGPLSNLRSLPLWYCT